MLDIQKLIAAYNPDRVCFAPRTEDDGVSLCLLPLFEGDFCAEHGSVADIQNLFRSLMYSVLAESDELDGLHVLAARLYRLLVQLFNVHIPIVFLYAIVASSGLSYSTH